MRDEREETRRETRKKEKKRETRDKKKKGKKELGRLLGRRPEPDFPAFEVPSKSLKDTRRINNHPKIYSYFKY